jgi:hypothetical protein
MAMNQKLSTVLRGRTLTSVHQTGSSVTAQLDDGGTMTVQGTLEKSSGGQSGSVVDAHEDGASLLLNLSGGASIVLKMNDPGGSVIVRDQHNVISYAG